MVFCYIGTKSFASFRINKDFWPNLAQKMVSLAHIGVAGSFGALVGWLVVVARAVSRKTPIYFMLYWWNNIIHILLLRSM